MMRSVVHACALAGILLLGSSGRGYAAEPAVRLATGYGIVYLPMIIIEEKKLLESQAARLGVADVKPTWVLLDGGNNVNDAVVAGAVDIAGAGVPGFLTLWSKTEGKPGLEVRALAGMSSVAMSLNTSNPNIKSLKDFTDHDKIALPGIKTSLAAVVMQMVVAHEFGIENYNKLDKLTVGLPYPEAYAALTSGKSEITSHFASPPYSEMEMAHPGIRRIVNSVDMLGNTTSDLVFAPKKYCDANPKICTAFIAALNEADAFIKASPEGAAQIYVKAAGKNMNLAQVVEMIKDKDAVFTTTPVNTMAYAEFMSRAGTIKLKPKTWKDYFLSAASAGNGS
jgi:NitT/TauT family transport system substrate-binding protein